MAEKISIQDAIDTLHREKCSCVILKDNELSVYNQPGIADLVRLLKTEPEKLQGAFVADKVIGKVAAALLILGEVKAVYTDLISDAAVELFRATPIEISFAERVPVIMNRTKENICPMENLCSDALTPRDCYARITDFLERIKAGSKG